MTQTPPQTPDNARRLTNLARQIEVQHTVLTDLAALSREQAAELRNIAQSLTPPPSQDNPHD